jgi:hypothetical protein
MLLQLIQIFSERKRSRSETEASSPTRRNQAKTHAAGRGGIPSPYKRWARQVTNDWKPGQPVVGLRSTTTTRPPLLLSSRSDETDPVHPVQRTGSDRTGPNRPAHVVCLPDPPKLPRRARPIHLHPQTYPGRRAVVCDCAAQVADGDSIFVIASVIAKAGVGFAVVDDHAPPPQIRAFSVSS